VIDSTKKLQNQVKDLEAQLVTVGSSGASEPEEHVYVHQFLEQLQ
jgi:hypothetical protein